MGGTSRMNREAQVRICERAYQLRVSGGCASMRLPGIPRVRTARDGRPSLSSYFSARSSRRLFVN